MWSYYKISDYQEVPVQRVYSLFSKTPQELVYFIESEIVPNEIYRVSVYYAYSKYLSESKLYSMQDPRQMWEEHEVSIEDYLEILITL